MRQHITLQDLESISPKAKEKLREWWKPKNFDLYISPFNDEIYVLSKKEYDATVILMGDWKSKAEVLPLLNIGQMIELLDGHTTHWYEGWIENGSWDINVPDAAKLCDALWSACKEILEKE